MYLDVFLVEVDGTPDLDNKDDVGIQTSVRIKAVWIVRVAENAQAPPTPPADGHTYYPLAHLMRRRGEAKITEGPLADGPELRITDRRQQQLTVAALEKRLTRLEKALVAPSFKSGAGEISPRVGPVGIPVTLSGKNFDKLTITVKFDGVVVPSTGFLPLNANENPATVLKVKVPPGVTTEGVPKDVHITVSNEIGSDISDRVFQVSPRPVFVEGNQFSPTTGPPGTLVTLSGFNFTPGQPTVTFDSKNATVQPDATYTQLRVLVPDGIAPNTDVAITVSFPTRGPNMAADDHTKIQGHFKLGR